MNPEKKSSGSQFYIVQGGDVSDDILDMVEARTGMSYSPDQRELYKVQGGTPHLDTEYTVFGRVIEGLETLFAGFTHRDMQHELEVSKTALPAYAVTDEELHALHLRAKAYTDTKPSS